MKRIRITADQISDIFHLGERCNLGILTKSDAASRLNYHHEMNKQSALCYLTLFECMYTGVSFPCSINTAIIDYFLKEILLEYGMKAYAIALWSVQKTILEKPSKKLESVYYKHTKTSK